MVGAGIIGTGQVTEIMVGAGTIGTILIMGTMVIMCTMVIMVITVIILIHTNIHTVMELEGVDQLGVCLEDMILADPEL